MGSDGRLSRPSSSGCGRRSSEVERLWADNTRRRNACWLGSRDTAAARASSAGCSETIDWFSDPANLARYKTDIYNI